MRNYNTEMEKIIAKIPKGEKKTVLLHSCCAPCSSACIERLKKDFEIAVFYYNPNIDSAEEYALRAAEQERFCRETETKCIVQEYRPEDFYRAASGLENEPEGGKRCEKCFYLRLKATAEAAKREGFDYFTTTLTISPLKNAEILNSTGERLQSETGVKFLPSDFKKKNGYRRSVELSAEYGLYRQNYCGCIFSKEKNPR